MRDDFDKDDFFEKIPEEKPPKVKEPKKPVYKSDDPRYYEEEESKWEHLTPAPFRRNRWILYCASILVVFLLIYGFWVYFFTPEVDEAETYGYVESVERHGSFFKTYEGSMIPYRTIMDPNREYKGDFKFSTSNISLASDLKRRQRTGVPVKVTYVVYRHKFPWRGDTKTIVTSVDSINASVLLPPSK